MRTSINSKLRHLDFKFMMVMLFSAIWILTSITSREVRSQNGQALLKGSTVVMGTVVGIRGKQFEVEYGDPLQLRVLPLEEAKGKGMEITEGDKINMVFNERHVLLDFHPLGHLHEEPRVSTRVIHHQMPVGQECVVIKTSQDETTSFFVKPLARSKRTSTPVAVDAVVLAGQAGPIVDVAYGRKEGVEPAPNEYQRMSSPMFTHIRVDGVLFDSFENNTITIETSGGNKWTYHMRPLLKGELNALKQGDHLRLLIDSDNYVINVATPRR